MKRKLQTIRGATLGLLPVVLLAVAVVAGRAEPGQRSTQDPYETFLPAVSYHFDPSLGTPLFGVQMYGTTATGSKYHQLLIDSGASWLRVPIHWANIEPSNVAPESYNWSRGSDSALAAAREDMGDLNIIVTIDHNPDWAADLPHGPIKPVHLPDFQEFVGALVERYDGDGLDDAPGSPVVNFWEFYNEPDAGVQGWEIHWGTAGTEYAQMLASIYPAVKAANPDARVVFGGIAHDWFEDQNGPFVRAFLDDVLSAGGGEYFDVMNFHAYPSFAFNWTTQGPGLLEKAQFIRGKLSHYGYGDKPLIVTEAGWHSNDPPQFPGSQEIQARYVVELFAQSMAADVPVMIWWMLYDPGGFYWDNGLVTHDDPPVIKSSFVAYQKIVAELGTAHFDRILSVAETGASEMEAYKFDDRVNQRHVYVAWLDPIDSSNSRPLRLAAAQATTRDIYGNSHVVTDVDDGQRDGRVTVSIGGQPTYIEISK